RCCTTSSSATRPGPARAPRPTGRPPTRPTARARTTAGRRETESASETGRTAASAPGRDRPGEEPPTRTAASRAGAQMTRRRRASLPAAAAVMVIGLPGLGGGAAYHVGTLASAPAPVAIGAPPGDLPAEAVTFPSPSGSRLSGWLVAGEPRAGAVLLLHGIHA